MISYLALIKCYSDNEAKKEKKHDTNWACQVSYQPTEGVYFLIIWNKSSKSDVSPGLESSLKQLCLSYFLGLNDKTEYTCRKSWHCIITKEVNGAQSI